MPPRIRTTEVVTYAHSHRDMAESIRCEFQAELALEGLPHFGSGPSCLVCRGVKEQPRDALGIGVQVDTAAGGVVTTLKVNIDVVT